MNLQRSPGLFSRIAVVVAVLAALGATVTPAGARPAAPSTTRTSSGAYRAELARMAAHLARAATKKPRTASDCAGTEYTVWLLDEGYWHTNKRTGDIFFCRGEEAGTTGESRGIQFLGAWTPQFNASLCLTGHIQDIGDKQGEFCENHDPDRGAAAVVGYPHKRLEGVHISNAYLAAGWVCAQAHVQTDGWQPQRCNYYPNKIWVGTSHESKRMEAIKIWAP